MLFSIQYACARSWLDCGLKVETLIGHSFGQLTALCVAGCLSLVDGISLISTRAHLIRDQWGPELGVMLSVEGDLQDVETLLAYAKKRHGSCDAEIACYNGPRLFVLAGSRTSIEAVEEESRSERLAMRVSISRLKNTHAFHSRLADSILPGLGEIAESLHFKRPSIRIETCSIDQSWSKVGAHEIMQHTRMPVYFSQAVERVAERQKSTIWLEAGSGSSIIAMARRVLKSCSEAQHIFQPVDLGSPNAQSNLAKTSCQLWVASSEAQFWPFHDPPRNRFSWIHLPPYQFEKSRHWLEHNPPIKSSGAVAKPAIDQQSEIVQVVGTENGNSGEVLFSVDPMNKVFELCTRGHAVLHHSLCPASLYFEIVIKAIRILAEDQSSAIVPHIRDLTISSPLGLNPTGQLFLLLSRDKNQTETWTFSLFSRDPQDESARSIHASGYVALLASNNNTAVSRFQSLKRLVGSSRYEEIMKSPDATVLNGKLVYKIFGRTVDYADYYRGVKRVFANDHEVVGHVSVPGDQPLSLTRSCCDPIAIDNFLQVAGIHVNCLSDCKEDEVFVCTAIGDLSLSEQFNRNQGDKRSWTVYSTLEPMSRKCVASDILVHDSHSGELVLTLMGVQFTSILFKSLEKILSKFNGVRQSKSPDNSTVHSRFRAVQDEAVDESDYSGNPNGHDALDTDGVVPSSDGGLGDQAKLLQRLREMLSEVIEIPVCDIRPDSALADLGVDSLMITEVINEIKRRFKVTVSVPEFQGLTDLQSLLHHLLTLFSSHMPNGNSPTSFDDKSTKDPQPLLSTQVPKEQGHAVSDHKKQKCFTSVARDCFVRAKNTFDSVANDTRFIGFCHSVYPSQGELVVAYVVEAFASLGCPLGSLDPHHRLPDIHYSSKHTKAMSQLYKILEEADLITRSSGVLQRTAKDLPATTAKDLQAALLQKYPEHASEHKLLHTTGQKLADCLTEHLDPLSLLFGDAKARLLLEDVYTNAPMFKSGTTFLAQYLVSIFRHFDFEQEIRILELGAGTGGTTSYIVELLATSQQKFQYTFTDLSSSMVGAARKRFARHDFMHYAILDVEESPPPQFLSKYDIVISSNCIHATRDLTLSCTNIKEMLRPDGILCLIELTQNLFWFDLVFGLLEGWWLFEDGRQHVLADEGLWSQCLRSAGYQWVDWTEGDSEESRILRVFAASPSAALPPVHEGSFNGLEIREESQETVVFNQEGDTELLADVYYPEEVGNSSRSLPIGEAMSSR